jgi:oxygen-dependent protoporphyrinogen oxidase
MKVAIIGAGISGLAAAHRLLSGQDQSHEALDLTIFESGHRPGGIIETIVEDGLVLEQGPDSFITVKPAALDLCRQLGLENRLISTNPNPLYRRAFIARRGALSPIPGGFAMVAPSRYDTFFKSDLLSRWGKLRMAIEQFIPRGSEQDDESVASFIRRRFGPEAVDQIAQPMLGGIYTANVQRLSARATLAKFCQYERDWGSVAEGLRREPKEQHSQKQSSGARYSAFLSLEGGLQNLVNALVQSIGEHRIRCNTSVSSMSKDQDGHWSLSLSSGGAEKFTAVILAIPAFAAAKLTHNFNSQLAELFSTVKYTSSAVVTCLYDRAQISHPLDGFGFVVPPGEKKGIIAGSFASVKFSGRCPQDQVLIRAFIGGVLQHTLLDLPSSELIDIAAKDLAFYLGISGDPKRFWIRKWPNSMPQYEVGHLERVASASRLIERHENLFYAGAALNGVGLPDCIASGQSAADSLYALYTLGAKQAKPNFGRDLGSRNNKRGNGDEILNTALSL